jgi:hypothetical protein
VLELDPQYNPKLPNTSLPISSKSTSSYLGTLLEPSSRSLYWNPHSSTPTQRSPESDISSRPITRWNHCIMWWERTSTKTVYVDLPKFRDTRLRRNKKMEYSYFWARREAEGNRLLALIVWWMDMEHLLLGGGERWILELVGTCITCWVWCSNKICSLYRKWCLGSKVHDSSRVLLSGESAKMGIGGWRYEEWNKNPV